MPAAATGRSGRFFSFGKTRQNTKNNKKTSGNKVKEKRSSMPPVLGNIIAFLLIGLLIFVCIRNITSTSCSGSCSDCGGSCSGKCGKTLPPEEVHRRIQKEMKRKRRQQKKAAN